LAFGVLFATAITLLLVPSLYLMLEDWLHFWGLDSSVDPALIVHEHEQEQDDAVTSPGGR